LNNPLERWRSSRVGALLAAPDPFMNVHRGSVIIRHYAHRLPQHLTIDDALF
jgi:hypothetical protein